ncbi:pectate lyase [Pseudoduganella plicata]|uniref:Pectate lyase n=1 Tax=Pseudoduganella plicata TaxID=321984 RepID=A0A4P7BBJ7_9BURK|nr:pectate lyase [Pseudoduganella plicata]QBQ35443.1 pectate lyase [Pseudoduganella plicata]GGZ01812.1 pectate lyase [Pseudoduganella plicata]
MAIALSLPAAAGVIGTMTPAQPVTATRIAALPANQQPAWRDYLARSQASMAADKAALAAERDGGPGSVSAAPHLKGESGMPVDRPAVWYASADATTVADNIVSFQTPAGGWGKNVDRRGPPRRRGEHYAPVDDDPSGGVVSRADGWSYVGTIDNDATIAELRFLARVQAARPDSAGDAYRASALKGIGYLLQAQYPNGGYPQVYPLQGGYHDAITFNDDAIAQVVGLLGNVAARQGDYAFVPADLAARAATAQARAIEVILASQVRAGGVRTGWCQQHDALTLAPVGARNFEPVALSTAESARLLMLLMALPQPRPEIVAAVEEGVAWLQRVAVQDVEWHRDGERGRVLVSRPGAGPLWPRLVGPVTMRPVFGDRDRTIHTDVNELSRERRDGYAWYGTGPATALAAYRRWTARQR